MVDFGGTFSVALAANWIAKLARRLGRIRGERAEEIKEIALEVTGVDPRALAKLYIEPNVQYINPADYDAQHTLERPFGFRIQINTFIDPGPVEKDGSHVLFILGDAGMGKTSALVMLRMSQVVGFWPDGLHFEVFKLGEATLDELERLKEDRDPTRTVVLLDSLDEDPTAFNRAKDRLHDLLEATKVFHRVVLTCRTQFFPQHAETEEDQERVEKDGRIRVGGYYCNLVYLSRFNNDQVGEYLHKKFPFWSWYRIVHRMSLKGDVRKRAHAIVANMQELRMRPLLLSYIEELLKSNVTGTSILETYKALVFRWLMREVRKIKDTTGKDVDPMVLLAACEDLAFHLQVNERNTISLDEIEERIPDALKGTMEAIDIGGRSLLNRTSAGEYRFAHRTIQEYLAFQWVLKSEEELPNKRVLPRSEPINAFLRDHVSKVRLVAWSPNLYPLVKCLFTLHLYKANLFRAKLSGADLNGAKLNGADLTGADLSGANLNEADLYVAKLKGAKLNGAELNEAILFRADLTEAILFRAGLNGAKLNEAELNEADLMMANLNGAQLNGAKLNEAHLSGARLIRAGLRGADLRGADLSGADLSGAELNEAIINEAHLTGAKLNGAKLNGAHLTLAQLNGARLNEAHLNGAQLNGAKLNEAHLSGARLNRAGLYRADLSGADLSGADLSGADLRGAKLNEAHLSGADLSEAKLRGADLSGAILGQAKVTKAQLDQAKQG